MKLIEKIILLPVFSLLAANSYGLEFSGYEWIIKNQTSLAGPGPNYFSADTIIPDKNQQNITLSVKQIEQKWYSSELFSTDLFSYGEFSLTFSIPLKLDSQLVFGFFLYNERFPPYYNEVDFEIAEWGNPVNNNCQFSIQPYQTQGNSFTFNTEENLIEYKIVVNWQKNSVRFNLYDKEGLEKSSWIYNGENIPKRSRSRVHMNLWSFQGQNPLGNGSLKVKIHNFKYIESK
ncbi:MAG: family 16 glycosylhydrolase [Spirochaetaceae bacterium]|jgi:hypothetical protein|nr:family 16 glycosylhydrolase [Spirochaetaceae bacterium]